MNSMLTFARRAATAVLSAALTVGVVSLPAAAQAAPVADASVTSKQALATTTVEIIYFDKPTRTTRGELVARAGSSLAVKPTGSFRIKVKKGTTVVVRKSAAIVGGRATVGLPRLAKGKYTLVVRYPGDSRHSKGVARRGFSVA
jgi:hypothetical protein